MKAAPMKRGLSELDSSMMIPSAPRLPVALICIPRTVARAKKPERRAAIRLKDRFFLMKAYQPKSATSAETSSALKELTSNTSCSFGLAMKAVPRAERNRQAIQGMTLLERGGGPH